MIKASCVQAVFNTSLKLASDESCLIVTDTEKDAIGSQFYSYASSITSQAKLIVMEPTKEHGAEPPREVSRLMQTYAVQVLVTAKSLSHTQARRGASLKGARIASMPDITEEIANRCLDIDYEALRADCMRLHGLLLGARSVRISTERGTDFEAAIGTGRNSGRKIYGENGGVFDAAGAFGNLPEGEVSFWPKNAKGKYIVDASFPGLGKLDAPLSFRVDNGSVFDIEGRDAQAVRKRLRSVGSRAFFVAEVGIGMNPKAVITGNILEDEKALGTIHIAVGNNLSYGGTNDVPLHLDGVIKAPDIYVDGHQIMKKGTALW